MAPSATASNTSTVTVKASKSALSNTKEEQRPIEALCHGPVKLAGMIQIKTCPRHIRRFNLLNRQARRSLKNSILPLLQIGIPTFPTFTSRRLHSLNHMAALFRHWSRHNYTEGLSGHISVRDPEYPHLFWTNPLAIHFGLLKASDMLLLSDRPEDGEVILAGNARSRPANKAGWAIHAAIHRKRGDVNAVCHAHTHYGRAWSSTGKKLEMINQDVCNFYGEALALHEDYGGLVLGDALGEGDAIAEALGGKGKAAILVNHGLLSVGTTVDEAGFLFGLLERCCGLQLEVEKARCGKKIIADKEAEFNFRLASTPVSLSTIPDNGKVGSKGRHR